MGELVTVLNAAGGAFVAFAAHMLIQSSVLIILLAALDLVLRRRVKAVVRYWIWLLVLAKLILPPSFSSPTGVAYWVGGMLPTLSGPIEPLVGESSSPSLPTDGTAVSAEPQGPDSRPSVRYASEEPPVARSDNTPLSVAPPVPLVTWQALVLSGWAVVVIVMGVVLAQRALFIRRLVAQSRAPGPEIVELLGQCARRMGVRTDLAVKLSPLSASPSVCGLWRPVILIPEGMLARLPVPELRSVLFHELAHIKRGDLWLNLLQTLLQVVYFYHPLVWATNVRIRRVREQAVDETVLAAMGDEAEDYPRTLLSVSRAAFGQPTLSLRLLGVVESEKALMDRIRHMVSRPFPKNAKLGFTGLIMVFAVGAILLPMAQGTPTRMQKPSPGRSPDSSTVASVSGVTVEFLGVRPYSETDESWWRADGTPATGMNFPEFKEFRAPLLTLNDPNARVRVLAVRLAGPSLDDVTVSWSLTNSEGSHSTPYFPMYTVQQADEKPVLRPVHTIVARFVDEAATTDLKFGIAAGPWKDAAAGSEGHTTVYARDNITQKDVIYHPAQETDRSLIITATHLLSRDYDCRIVAEDENHRVFEPIRTNNSAGKCLSVLKVPRAQVKWFRLQARPYEWVEFKNVHLLPMARGTETRPSETSQSRDRLQTQDDPELAELIRTAVANHQGANETEILEITRRITDGRAQILLLDQQIEDLDRRIEATPGPGETRDRLLRSKKEVEAKRMTEMGNLREAMGIVPRLAFDKQPTANLNAWVSLQVLEQRVVVLDTLKPFSEYWPKERHKVVGSFSEKETLDYLQGRLKDAKSLPIRIPIYYLPETKRASEDLRQKILALAREGHGEMDTEVRLEPSTWVGSGESPFYLREGKITTFYPYSLARPDGGPKPITSGLVDPNDLEQHILWRLTMPKNLPLTFRVEYDQASSQLAKQVADTARAVAKRVGLVDLVNVMGVLVESVPERAFLGKWQARTDGVIQSVEIQPGGVCQAIIGEGIPSLQAGARVTGTWVWTARGIQFDINDPMPWTREPLHFAYRAAVNQEGDLLVERGEIYPQGSFHHTHPPQRIFKRVQ